MMDGAGIEYSRETVYNIFSYEVVSKEDSIMSRMRRVLDWFLCLLGAALIGFFNGWKMMRGIADDEYPDQDHARFGD